jgi:Rieske Fe-S protein
MDEMGTDSAAVSDAGAVSAVAGSLGPRVTRREVVVTATRTAGAVAVSGLALAACSTPSGTAGPVPLAAGIRLTPLARVPLGRGLVINNRAGVPIVVAQPTMGTAVAFSAICPHQGCTVAPDGTRMKCPCHGSLFDAATGRVLHGPAMSGLVLIPVRLDGGEVVTS